MSGGTIAAALVLAVTLALLGAPGTAEAATADAHANDDASPDEAERDATVSLIVSTHGAAGGAAATVDRAGAAVAGGVAVRRPAHPGALERLDTAVVEVPAAEADAAAAALAADPGVRAVEVDAWAETADLAARAETAEAAALDSPAPEPNDPRYPDQRALATIDAAGAWARTVGDDEVVVAVLDTGVDADHEDLAGGVLAGRNFTDDGAPDDTRDANGHGTHVAGTVAARADNGVGVAGMCWRCTILPVKVLGNDGRGRMSGIAAGIVWAADAGADVINLSLSGTSDLLVMREAVAHARRQGAVVVAAAGKRSDDAPVFPGAYRDVIAVAGSTDHDARCETSGSGGWVELAAPCATLAPVPQPNALGCDGDYCEVRGSSMATALVSGTAALTRSLAPQASPEQVRAALTGAAVDVGEWVSAGRLDAAGALSAAADAVAAPDGGFDEVLGDVVALPPGVHRVAGADRFATAAQLSAATFPPGVARVYVATGAGFADALAAGAVAGADRAPVLLTARDALPAVTRDELGRLQADEVVVVGGTSAVAEAVARAAGDAAGAPVRRLSGRDRFATAAAVAADAGSATVDVAYVATGADYPDALAAVPAAVADHAPLLLTAGQALPAATREVLALLQPDRVVVLGGREAVPDAVVDDLTALAGDGVTRVAGADRYATAAAVADHADLLADAVLLATGADYPDALAGGPVAGLHGGPLLLAAPDDVPAATATQLRRLRPAHVTVLGGPAALSPAVEEHVAALLR